MLWYRVSKCIIHECLVEAFIGVALLGSSGEVGIRLTVPVILGSPRPSGSLWMLPDRRQLELLDRARE